MGLHGCLEYELERLQNSGQYQTSIQVSGTAVEPPLNKAFVVYRVAQECLNNIIKHAKASHIAISMSYEPGQLVVTVTDNGIGFDTAVYNKPGGANGLGLRNMQQRMALINGRFECECRPGSGARCLLTVPAGGEETGTAVHG
jgi:two-component system, NarL family, sensor kinase